MVGDDREEIDMSALALNERYILDEEAAKKILTTPAVKLPKSNEFNDLYLSDKERIAHALNVIKGRKCR
jgi:hypothetical protein